MENRFYFTCSKRHAKVLKELLITQDCKVRLSSKKLLDNGNYKVSLDYDKLSDLCSFFYYYGAASYQEFLNE